MSDKLFADSNALAANLVRGANGIWYSKARARVSYPEEGNLNCLQLEENSFWFEHRNACILALVRRFQPQGLLLDVGGGNGYVTLGLQQAGLAAALLEPGEQGASNAARRGVQLVICSTLEDAGFASASFGAVGLFDVLEHIEDETAFLRTVCSVLAPGGRLYITVPAHAFLWSADDDYAGHFRRYTLSGLCRVVQALGLQVDFASYFFFFLPLPIFLLRALPSHLGLRKQNAWASYRQEHNSRSGLVGRLLNRVLAWERVRLERGQPLAVGASCLLAARRP